MMQTVEMACVGTVGKELQGFAEVPEIWCIKSNSSCNKKKKNLQCLKATHVYSLGALEMRSSQDILCSLWRL